MNPIGQQSLIAMFTNLELRRHGTDAESLLLHRAVGTFVDWAPNKDPDF